MSTMYDSLISNPEIEPPIIPWASHCLGRVESVMLEPRIKNGAATDVIGPGTVLSFQRSLAPHP